MIWLDAPWTLNKTWFSGAVISLGMHRLTNYLKFMHSNSYPSNWTGLDCPKT